MAYSSKDEFIGNIPRGNHVFARNANLPNDVEGKRCANCGQIHLRVGYCQALDPRSPWHERNKQAVTPVTPVTSSRNILPAPAAEGHVTRVTPVTQSGSEPDGAGAARAAYMRAYRARKREESGE